MAQQDADPGSALITIDGAGEKVVDAELPGSWLEAWRRARPLNGARAGDAIRSDVPDRDADPKVDDAENHRHRNRAQVEVLLLALEARHRNMEP